MLPADTYPDHILLDLAVSMSLSDTASLSPHNNRADFDHTPERQLQFDVVTRRLAL